MKRGTHLLVFVGALISVLLPLSALFLDPARSVLLVLSLTSVLGWGLVIFLLREHREAIRRIRTVLGLSSHVQRWDEDLQFYLDEFSRIYRAGFSMPLDNAVDSDSLGRSLTALAELSREEFGADAVELSLFDESSGLRSKSFLSGTPRTSEAQGMNSAELSTAPSVMSVPVEGGSVLRAPIRFSGVTFGEVRIELQNPPREGDFKVIRLFAIQAAVLILNSRFTGELVRMRQKGEESNRAKTGFLATLSHEIRGPLGIILNGVELMLEGLCGEVTPKGKDTLGMLKSSGEHLLDLVNDVLDYAKLEAGKVTPKTSELPLKRLLEDLMNVVRAQAQTKDHRLTLEPIAPDLGVLCDKRHLRQMMINLLTNAIKYTPEGGTITVKAESVDGVTRISVQDTGVGIEESQWGRVFSPFERVDDQYSQSQQGTGLGMPLTKKLAQANGGDVEFISTVGTGSTFTLSLPACESNGSIKPELSSGSWSRVTTDNFGKGETILLVDPDSKARQMIETYLKHQGFNVLTAETGREVVRILRDTPLHLLILENDLPDLSGEEMVEALRAHPKGVRLPIVLLSAKAFVFDIEHFLKLGVDRCLSKPVDLKEIAATARRLIDDNAVSGPPVQAH